MSPIQLTAERLFSDPPLTVAAPHTFKFAPDGSMLTFLRVSEDDRERMDLWRYDFASASQRCLLDARAQSRVPADVTQMTEAERAERERRRQFAFGITQYDWHPNALQLLIPIDGHAYLVDAALATPTWHRLTPDGTRQSGFTFSPQGNFVSYVRDGDLYYVALATGNETRVTHDAGPTQTNGLPDFLAAEEMHRFSGHWWSQDEASLAYCKVDDSAVAVSRRLEIDANGTRTVEQRYPYAGASNPQVALNLFTLDSQSDTQVWATTEAIPYLARVDFNELGLFIQTQDRLQQRLTLQRLSSTDWEICYEDHSDTWINLSDDLRVVGSAILLTSEDRGTRRAMLIADQIVELHGPTHINRVLRATESLLLVSGWSNTPIENHLYQVHLDGSGYDQITTESGWHDVTVNTTGSLYVDRFTSEAVALRIDLCQGPANAHVERAAQVIYAEDLNHPHPYAPYAQQHAQPIFGHVAAEDGQTMYYRITPPRALNGKHPIVVYVYGGPGAQKVRREWGSMLLQLFAEHGFGVLELDNRGSTNLGSQFEEALFRAMGQAEVRDQVRGLAVLDELEWADTSRVGVFGHSYGGYMALQCLCQAGDHFVAGVAVAPVCDWRLYDTHYTERYLGLPSTDNAAYDASNVLTNLVALERPLLLMHGMADDNVLFTHTTMLMSALQQMHKPFELMAYPGAKHSMQERHVSIHRFDAILDFFQRTLS